MDTETIIKIYRTAWAGIDGKPNGERVRDRYLHQLRTARTSEARRNVCAELLAEGLLAAGGSGEFAGEEPCLDLWRTGEADGWESVRNAALLASAAGGES